MEASPTRATWTAQQAAICEQHGAALRAVSSGRQLRRAGHVFDGAGIVDARFDAAFLERVDARRCANEQTSRGKFHGLRATDRAAMIAGSLGR